MKDLTKRQKAILDFIKEFIEENKFPPTIREIANYFKITPKGCYDHLKALEKKKHLKWRSNHSRSLELLKADNLVYQAFQTIPILGSVAAGKPLFAHENLEGEIKLPQPFLKKGRYFALKIKGDSMLEAGIIEGDLALIRVKNQAENGDIVVALLDDAVTLKRFYREKNRIMLKAENKNYAPIYTLNVKILGKLECIIRKYE